MGTASPLAFAFEEEVYFRLGDATDSQKRRYVDASEQVTVVACDEPADGWKSALAWGRG